MSKRTYDSILDIVGPEMIGPSSSHTAGAARIGLAARSILNSDLIKARIHLYNSFADTGIGHGTHKAMLAGLMGYSPADENICDAENLAREKKIKFSFVKNKQSNDFPPNTAKIEMSSRKWDIEVIGASIGGGLIIILQIDGFDVNITGEYETLIITHKDKVGTLADILNVLSKEKINIVSINSVRHNKIDDIKTVITVDNILTENIRRLIKPLNNIVRVRIIHKIQEIW